MFDNLEEVKVYCLDLHFAINCFNSGVNWNCDKQTLVML